MIREKLLELDLDRQRDVDEAPPALALGGRVDLARDENTLVNRLEAHVEIELRIGANAHEPLTHGLLDEDRELLFAHLAGMIDEVTNVQTVRRMLDGHGRRFYAPADWRSPNAA